MYTEKKNINISHNRSRFTELDYPCKEAKTLREWFKTNEGGLMIIDLRRIQTRVPNHYPNKPNFET